MKKRNASVPVAESRSELRRLAVLDGECPICHDLRADTYRRALQKIENRLSGHPHPTDLQVIGEWTREALGDQA